MIVLGLNAFHADSSACLVIDGELVAAAEEERFARIKHWAGYPAEAIAYCLAEAGARIDEVDAVAVNADSRAAFWPRVAYALKQTPTLDAMRDRFVARRARGSLPDLLRRQFTDASRLPALRRVEHHHAHLASAYLASPFEEATVLSLDGFGDFASSAWGRARGGALAIEGRTPFPHSLGVFYATITQHLGFPHYGDEYKAMGLAPYGEPSFLKAMRQIVRVAPEGGFTLDLACFRHPRERIAESWNGGAPSFGALFTPKLEAILGPRRRLGEPLIDRHRDLAASAQAIFEEALWARLLALHRAHGLPHLALAGGAAMNSVAVGKIPLKTPFRDVYVPPAPGDAGGALGAAFVIASPEAGVRRFPMEHAYWGPQFDPAAAAAAARALAREPGARAEQIENEAALFARVAAALADGQVIGWLQGRMEFGPRALGARSILGDPRRADMKAILNRAIKKRESFRPFAPTVLAEYAADWFETESDLPFMSTVVPVRRDKRARVPAITHVDGSARPQTLTAGVNPRFHALISAFHRLTGVPMLINTSFNENEPIVCSPADAANCFRRTDMDMLVLGDWLIERETERTKRSAAAEALTK